MSLESSVYFGWKIFAYRYYHSEPDMVVFVSKQQLLEDIHRAFSRRPEWKIAEQDLLTHEPTQSEVKVQIDCWDLKIPYDEGDETETYLCMLHSKCNFAYKQRTEDRHRRLMFQVLRVLPRRGFWEENAGGWTRNNHVEVVSFTNMEKGFAPFEVIPQKWLECPIPESRPKPQRYRLRRLRPKPKTSYLGTRTKTLGSSQSRKND